MHLFARICAAGFFAACLAAAPAGARLARIAQDEVVASARRQFDAAQYGQAAAALRVALATRSHDPALHFWLARCMFELGDFESSAQSAEAAVELEPNNSEYHQWLGRAYGRKAEKAGVFSAFGLAKKTRKEFEEAVRLNPRNFSAQADLIDFYLHAPGIVGGGDEKAAHEAELVLALDPAEGHLGWGTYWAHKHDNARAIEEFHKALAARPSRIELCLDIAEFYRDQGMAKEMEQAVEAAAAIDPAERRLIYYRGVARVLAGDRLGEAEKMLMHYATDVPLRDEFPGRPNAWTWLGKLYELQGRREEALAAYRKAISMDPRYKPAREALKKIEKMPK